MKIAVAGTGYVGLSLAVLLARYNTVYAVDIIPEKVEMINRGKSPIKDKEIETYLASGELSLKATADGESAYHDADFVIVSTPTDYDPEKNYFDTSSVETVIAQVTKVNPKAYIIVKSTVPIGFTKRMREKFGTGHILFSPEFLREGRALYDNLYPSRIIVGAEREDAGAWEAAQKFSALLRQAAEKEEVEVLLMAPTEAEAVKLFANTYLAMRVAYFNELDSYAERQGLDAAAVIRGVGLDPRIGIGYNNPSFGYGGYCFPKDTKQLLADYTVGEIPNRLIRAVVESNTERKAFITGRVMEKLEGIIEPTVGICRLIMKSGSDNFRQSAIQDIISMLKDRGVHVVIYEPTLSPDTFLGCKVIRDFSAFAAGCDLILANRRETALERYKDKVYTRDLFSVD